MVYYIRRASHGIPTGTVMSPCIGKQPKTKKNGAALLSFLHKGGSLDKEFL